MVLQQSLDYRLLSQAAAAAFAAARLLHFRLRERFPYLFFYLLVFAVSSVLMSGLQPTSHLYFWVYLPIEFFNWLVSALAVREMFTLIFKDFPGIRTTGWWTVNVALVISVAISLFVGTLFPAKGPNKLYYHLVFDRSINFSLALLIIALLWLLSRYPLDLDRNTYVVSGFFSAMFLAGALVKFVDSISKNLANRRLDSAEVVFSACCLIGWGLLLRAAAPPKAPRPPSNQLRETELLQQLEKMNKILTRSRD